MCHEKFFRFFSVVKKHKNHSSLMDHTKKTFGHNLLTHDLAQGFLVCLSFRITWRHFQNADSEAASPLPEDSDPEGLGNLYFLQKAFLWCVHGQGCGIADTHLTQPSHLFFVCITENLYYILYWVLFHCMDRDHILLVCSSVDMFFRSLAVVNNDLWTSVCQFLCGHMCLFLLGIYQGVGLLGHTVTSSFLCTHLRLRTWSPPYRRSHASLSCPSVSFLRLECPAEPSTCTCVCSQFPTHVQLFVTPWTAEIVRTVHGILQARILEWIVISSSTAFSSYCWRKSLRNFMWLVNSCIANQWHNQNSNPGLEPSSVIFVQTVLYHFLPP